MVAHSQVSKTMRNGLEWYSSPNVGDAEAWWTCRSRQLLIAIIGVCLDDVFEPREMVARSFALAIRTEAVIGGRCQLPLADHDSFNYERR